MQEGADRPNSSGIVLTKGFTYSVGQLADKATHSGLKFLTFHHPGCHVCPEIGPGFFPSKNGIHAHTKIVASKVSEIGIQFCFQVFALVFQVMYGPVEGVNIADWSAHGINIDHRPPLHLQNFG
jgi:hypothetical protein